MSKKISILEDVSKPFRRVQYLRTPQTGGGEVLWAPEDERQLLELSVYSNGLYRASDYLAEKEIPYWGFSQAVVNVQNAGRAIGIKPTDGNEYCVEIDNNGNIVEHILPSSISIETPPTKTEYREGEDIDITGMVVKAYKNDGELWNDTSYIDGIIPLEQLDYSPKICTGRGDVYEKDGVRALALTCDVYSDYDQYCNGWHYASPVNNGNGTTFKEYIARDTEGIIYYALYNGGVFGATLDSVGSKRYLSTDPNGMTGFGQNPSYVNKGNFKSTVYGPPRYFENIISMIPDNTIAPYSVDFHGAKVLILVTVSWNRPYDQKELTDSFEITVEE